MAPVLKTGVAERSPWVRIPPSPPFFADLRRRRMPSVARRAKDGLYRFSPGFEWHAPFSRRHLSQGLCSCRKVDTFFRSSKSEGWAVPFLARLRMARPLRTKQVMYYVYLLRSQSDPTQVYTGFTEDLRQRLKDHNSGKSVHTKRYLPWTLETYVAFSDRGQALDFERYLKTASGIAFSRKRLRPVSSGKS